MIRLLKRNYILLLLALLLAFASCSFTTKTFNDPDKDKLLIQLITYVLEQGHFSPKDINDDFSNNVFEAYLNQIDPYKRYFYEADIKEFKKYQYLIDDQIKSYDLTFFNLTYERLLQRVAESKSIYEEVLSEPFNYDLDETFNADYENLDYVKNKKQMRDRWRQQLKFSTIANYEELIAEQENNEEKETLKSLTELESESRANTLENLNELYVFIDERERKDWFSVYINAIVEEFDPHTFYFAPEEKDRFDVAMSGNFEGIGARLQKKLDAVIVNEIISGGPAWRQNELEVGDKIMRVRQENEDEAISIAGMRLDDAIKFIKGPKGTVVTLTVKKVDGTIKDITITRDIVELEETYAKSAILEKDNKKFGVINLPKFYVDFTDYKKRNAASDVKQEILRLKEQGVGGLVLDLRNNGGGSLQTVVDIAGLFIKEGPVVQVKTAGEPKEVLRDKDRSIIWDGPLVILVNELSASASEILAAAMQDYKRAIVIGSKQTYGKGTVQNVLDLNRMVRRSGEDDMGALKFTTQKFYRINGGSTQLEGVKSDVVVPDRYSYIDIGEKDQNNPLPWDKISPVNYDVWDGYLDFENTIEKSTVRMANNEQLKLIDANAQWVKTIRDKNIFSLNYEKYKEELKQNELEAKRFEKISEYKNDLVFKSLPYETELMSKDSVLKEKRERWHQSLSKDVYVEEAINVLFDLKLANPIKTKLASATKE